MSTPVITPPTVTPPAAPATDLSKVLETVQALADNQKSMKDQLENLTKTSETNRSRGPFIRSGENVLTSRGYSYHKLFGAINGTVSKEDAKVEHLIHEKLQKLYVQEGGYVKANANSILSPMSSDNIVELKATDLAREIKDLVHAGVTGYDPRELAEIKKTLSWQQDTTGGALVAPPMMGELIELLRNNEVFMKAGCRLIPMPPSGRVTYPRQTSAATAYFVGESQSITDSTPGTGDLILQAHKLGVLIKVPNELFRFSAVSVEQFIREDMTKVMGLRMDKALLEDPGSQITPKGLINYANISKMAASSVGTNGDTFTPEDVNRGVGVVEEQNAVFKAWVMRPLLWAAIANRRADAVTAGDHAGPFVFNILRGLNDDFDVQRSQSSQLGGYPVLKSIQVNNTRVKGTGTNLSYILGGDFTDYVLAMSGVIEFQLSTQGDTPFTTDQTWIRGTTYLDGGPRHEASYVLIDSLLVA